MSKAHLAIERGQQDGGHLPLMVVLVQGARHGPLHKQMPVLWLVQFLREQRFRQPAEESSEANTTDCSRDLDTAIALSQEMTTLRDLQPRTLDPEPLQGVKDSHGSPQEVCILRIQR